MKTKNTEKKSPDELRKIYQKSFKLLDKTENELSQIKKALRKTVSRLTAVASTEDESVHTLIINIKSAVANTLDLKALDVALDKLFSVLNSRDIKKTKTETKDDRSLSDLNQNLL